MFAPMSRRAAPGWVSSALITRVTIPGSQAPELRMPPDTNWSTFGSFTHIVVLIPAAVGMNIDKHCEGLYELLRHQICIGKEN